MTRQEAINKLWAPYPAQPWSMGGTDATYFVDRLVALGMLKLDEPKSAREKFVDAIQNCVIGPSGGGIYSQYAVDGSDASILFEYVEKAGLKIVEK